MSNQGLLRGVITLVTLVTFIGICWWAYRPGNRKRFEEDGLLAFGDENPEIAEDGSRQSTQCSTGDSSEESQT